MKVETFTPEDVMKPIGPYSHIAKAGQFVSISATAGVDPSTGELVGPTVFSQTEQILKSFQLMLETVGSSKAHIKQINLF